MTRGAMTPETAPPSECRRATAGGDPGVIKLGEALNTGNSLTCGEPFLTRPMDSKNGFLIDSADPWRGKFHAG